jgi:hypothetical protein
VALRLEIASKGLETLEHDWAEHLYSKISDVESMIRIAFLALTSGRGEVPASFLDRSTDRVRGEGSMPK